MSDHLLRLARIVAEAVDPERTAEDICDDARQLVRDLEAAPYSSAPSSCYEDGVLRCKQPRTITREEFEQVTHAIANEYNCGCDFPQMARAAITQLGLTVEDA